MIGSLLSVYDFRPLFHHTIVLKHQTKEDFGRSSFLPCSHSHSQRRHSFTFCPYNHRTDFSSLEASFSVSTPRGPGQKAFCSRYCFNVRSVLAKITPPLRRTFCARRGLHMASLDRMVQCNEVVGTIAIYQIDI